MFRGGATRKINRALTKQNSSGFCPAAAVPRRGRAFPSTGRCGGFSLLLHVIIFIFSSFYFSPSIGFHRTFFIRSRRTLFARIPCTGVRLYIIYARVYIIITYNTPHYTHIGILYVYTAHDNNERRRNPFFSPPLRQRHNVTCVFARDAHCSTISSTVMHL